MTRPYNIVIFGATGITGQFLVLEAAKAINADPESFTWAVAGRTNKKLDSVLLKMSKEIGEDLSHVDKILADVSDQDSLRVMAQKCDVLLNCVGPYLLWGENVVKACIEEGTHYLDLSVELQFLEKMQLKFNNDAAESGSYIIGAAGLGSIPPDYGAVYLQNNFDGELNSVESYLNIYDGFTTLKINSGTYDSLLLMCSDIFELISLKRQLYPDPYYEFQYKLPWKPLCYNEDVKSWCVLMPIPDARIMERTQRYKYYQEKCRPVQTKAFMQLPSLFFAILACIGIIFIGIIVQFKYGLKILMNYPKLFTLGIVTKEGITITKEEMDEPFTFTLIGKGWEKASKEHSTPPNKKALLIVEGRNPAYGATVTIMLQAGLTIVKERGKMPSKGGVYTPGIAFARTTLADRLNNHGVTFTLEK